jgi:hypothetical protein
MVGMTHRKKPGEIPQVRSAACVSHPESIELITSNNCKRFTRIKILPRVSSFGKSMTEVQSHGKLKLKSNEKMWMG